MSAAAISRSPKDPLNVVRCPELERRTCSLPQLSSTLPPASAGAIWQRGKARHIPNMLRLGCGPCGPSGQNTCSRCSGWSKVLVSSKTSKPMKPPPQSLLVSTLSRIRRAWPVGAASAGAEAAASGAAPLAAGTDEPGLAAASRATAGGAAPAPMGTPRL